jgi:hypothetical protein
MDELSIVLQNQRLNQAISPYPIPFIRILNLTGVEITLYQHQGIIHTLFGAESERSDSARIY